MRDILSQLMVSGPPADTTVPAFVTTLHCALTLLRRYRPKANARLLILPSLVFIVSPWFLSSPLWLAIGVASHVAWFAACEVLLPNAAPGPRSPGAAPAERTARPLHDTASIRQARPASPQPPRPSRDFKPFSVLAVIEETPEIKTFRLGRPEGFAFKAGQFVMVRVSIDGKPLVRCYSITSPPSAPSYLEISVRRQGPVSNFLHEYLSPGMTIDTRGPGGAFVHPEGPRPLVLIAGGIGITPLFSMLRHTLENEPSRRVTLILSSRTAPQMPFLDELRVLARRHPNFHFVPVLSGGSTSNEFFSGRVDAKLLETVVPHLAESDCMICGPVAMIDDVRELVAQLGVPRPRIHFEKFEAAVASAAAAADRAPAVAKTMVTFRGSGRAAPVKPGESILEAAEGVGETIPSLCRVGACGTCRIRVIEGNVTGDFDAIDRADQAEGYVLACVAQPVTSCLVEV